MAGAFFTALLAATHPPRKNPALPHEKLRAFSLPQDSSVQLMFGAGRFRESALSTARGLRFHTAPRRRHSPHRLATPHKWFNRQRISTRPDVSPRPCGLNACSGAIFAGNGALKAAACLRFAATRLKFAATLAARWAMQLKSFN
jgi:hypothetical protein